MSIPVLDICQVMKERKSVRVYDSAKKIPSNTVHEIIELATTAPSAWNLQHWRFIVIDNPDMKEKIFPVAYNQEQVSTCSHLLVVLGDCEAYKYANELLSEQVEKGFMSEEAMDAQMKSIFYAFEVDGEKYGVHDAIRNASLAAMQVMLAAKSFGIDSCPMLSFKEHELINLLHIPERFKPVMMISLGYGAKIPYETIRRPVEEVIVRNSF